MSHIALMAIRWDGWVLGRDTQGRGEAWPLEIQGWEICHVPYARLRSDERKRGNHQIKIKKKIQKFTVPRDVEAHRILISAPRVTPEPHPPSRG